MCKSVLVKGLAASLVPSTPGSLRFPKPKNRGKEPTLQPGTTAGLGGGYLSNTLADKFLSREVGRKQRISCANPRRGQAGTGLRSRSLLLPGRGSGVASGRLWAGEGCGRGCKAERLPPSFGTSVPRSLCRPWQEGPEQPRGRVGRKVRDLRRSGPPGASEPGVGAGTLRGAGFGGGAGGCYLPGHSFLPPLPFSLRPST